MKILAFPRDANPYQELLYTPMRQQGVTVTYLDGVSKSHTMNLLLWPLHMLIQRLRGYDTFHLHWTYAFSLPWLGRLGPWIMEGYFCLFIAYIKLLGYSLVWTAHNVMPHEKRFAHDLPVRRFLSRRCDTIIAHSKSVIGQMEKYALVTDKTVVIPHGSYIGVYPDTVSKTTARQKLGISDSFVYLFFGNMRPYKGVDTLLDAFDRLHMPDAILVLAGRCDDWQLKKTIEQYRAKLGGKIVVKDGFIPDEELQYYYRSADTVVLPFAEVSTSGSALLALSFGIPVIAPRIGGLKDLPAETGLFYQPSLQHALPDKLLQAQRKPKALAQAGRSAYAYAKSVTWDKIAVKTMLALKRSTSL